MYKLRLNYHTIQIPNVKQYDYCKGSLLCLFFCSTKIVISPPEISVIPLISCPFSFFRIPISLSGLLIIPQQTIRFLHKHKILQALQNLCQSVAGTFLVRSVWNRVRLTGHRVSSEHSLQQWSIYLLNFCTKFFNRTVGISERKGIICLGS